MSKLSERYQNQTWLVRRWRDRHLILVPWVALRIWNFGINESWSVAWSIALGMCDKDRGYWWSSEEVKAMEEFRDDDDDENKNENVVRVSATQLEQEIEDLARECLGVTGAEAIAMLEADELDGTLIETLLQQRLHLLGWTRTPRSHSHRSHDHVDDHHDERS